MVRWGSVASQARGHQQQAGPQRVASWAVAQWVPAALSPAFPLPPRCRTPTLRHMRQASALLTLGEAFQIPLPFVISLKKKKIVITHNLGHGCGRDWSQEVLGATWWQAQGCRCTGSPPMLAQVHLACFFPQGLGGSRKVPGKVPSPGFCRREFKAHPHSPRRSLHQGAPRKSLEGVLWRAVPLGSAARVVPPPVPTL